MQWTFRNISAFIVKPTQNVRGEKSRIASFNCTLMRSKQNKDFKTFLIMEDEKEISVELIMGLQLLQH